MDVGDIALLVLIDSSKCFDVVGHQFSLLKFQIYMIGTKWF